MIGQTVRASVAKFLDRTLDLDALLKRQRGRYVACYHRVITEQQAGREWVHPSMWISPTTFEAQVSWMQQVGRIVPYHELMDFSVPNEEPLFSVTFDDGWRDNLTNALPILQRLDVPAIVFLATRAMENGSLIWPEDLAIKTRSALESMPEADIRQAVYELSPKAFTNADNLDLRQSLESVIEQLKLIPAEQRKARIAGYLNTINAPAEPLTGYMMTWNDAKELHESGVMIGSHSHTHQIFSEASPCEAASELKISRERIKSKLGIDPDAFAYPNARYKGSEGKLMETAGYRFAFRLHNLRVTSSTDRHFVPRFICCESTARKPGLMKLRLLVSPIF